jgi:hypothetical protein
VTLAPTVQPLATLPPLWLNSGGPSSRTRTERVQTTLLGRSEGHVRCPRAFRLGLAFGRRDPLAAMNELLAEHGFRSPEDLRDRYAVPAGRLIATALGDDTSRTDVRLATADEVLRQALMLGLCTQHIYDAARPVLWTRASLRRALELYDPAGFYA